MELSTPNTQRTVKRACFATVLIAGIGYALLAFLLYPLYIQMASNVAYQDSILLDLLYFLADGELVNLAVCILYYPFTMYAVWRAGFKKAWPVAALFASIDLLRFVVNFFMTALVNGALPDADEFLGFDLPHMLQNYFLEMIVYAFVILCVVLFRILRTEKLEAEAFQAGDSRVPPPLEGLFPIKGIFHLINPFQLSAFLCGFLLAMLLFGAQLINGLYEAITFADVELGLFLVSTAVDLVLDLLIGLLLYFSTLFIASRLHQKGY